MNNDEKSINKIEKIEKIEKVNELSINDISSHSCYYVIKSSSNGKYGICSCGDVKLIF